MQKVVTGLFTTKSQVDTAIQRLDDVGYARDDISVITRQSAVNPNPNKTDDIQAGATTGGIVGGLVGLLTGIGALTIPGIGALFIAGPITTALGLTGALGATASGAITGALAGGLIGALKDLGVDEAKAKAIEDGLKKGNTLLLVHCAEEDDKAVVKDILTGAGGEHVYELNLKK